MSAAHRTVLVDARHLAGTGATRGFGRYLRSLLGELAEAEEVSFSALVGPGARAALPPGIAARAVTRRFAERRFADIEHRLRLPLDLARHPSAVFHSPAAEPPRVCRRPWVQTLHDVPLAFADADADAEVERWRRRRRRVVRADAVIAVSRHVAEHATALLGLDPSRVHVVAHGVAPVFAPAPASGGRAEPGGRDAGPGRDGTPYLLLVSEYGPHKGYREAFALIGALAERGLPHRLVVVGRLAPWWRPTVDALVRESRRPDRIELAGLADDAALAAAYRGADALIVTSRAEGFGLPALEAMASATPVVAFGNTALPEILGEAGTIVPDGDVRALADAVAALVRDPERRRAAAAAALARSRAFTWQACAAGHLAVYRALLGQAGRSRARRGATAPPAPPRPPASGRA